MENRIRNSEAVATFAQRLAEKERQRLTAGYHRERRGHGGIKVSKCFWVSPKLVKNLLISTI